MENVKKFTKGILFTIFIGLLYFLICPYFFSMLFKDLLISPNFWINNISYLLVYICTFIVVLFIIRKDIFKQFKDFLSNKKIILNKGLTYWGYGIIIMLISNLIINSIVGNIASNEQSVRELLFSNPLYVIPTIVFFGPFFEEIIFRFCLRKSFNKELSYALTSSFIFGSLHIISAFDSFTINEILSNIHEFLFIIPYGSLGFFFAKSYYETDNIFSTIIPHMLHNSLSVLLILLTKLI